MKSARTRTIEALERVEQECKGAMAKGIHINQLIIENRLAVPPIDLAPIHATLQRAEQIIMNIELRANGAVRAAGMT